jgi:hypothetical protein
VRPPLLSLNTIKNGPATIGPSTSYLMSSLDGAISRNQPQSAAFGHQQPPSAVIALTAALAASALASAALASAALANTFDAAALAATLIPPSPPPRHTSIRSTF